MKTTASRRPVVSKPRRRAELEILEARIAPANAFAVDTSNNLLQFDTATPGTIIDTIPVSGLGTDVLVGIDFRPADGLLYAVGRTGPVGHIYTINASTGAATLVSTLAADPTDTTAPYLGLAGVEFGVDFNPVPDRLRVVSNTGEDLRINVQTGFVITDANLNPGTPNVVGAAYTNSSFGQTTTTLFTIDATSDTLNIQNPPNNGTQVPVGPLGINVGNVLEFDILATGTGTNAAFLAATVGGVTGLYSVNLATGAATLVSSIGGGATQVRGLAVTGGFTATAGADGNGPFVTFTGTTNAETLVVTEAGGQLRHNRFDAGDAGYASAFDFDSATAGVQGFTVDANNGVRIFVAGGGGADHYNYNTPFGNRNIPNVNVGPGTITVTNTATGGELISVIGTLTAGRITLTSDNTDIVPGGQVGVAGTTTSVTIQANGTDAIRLSNGGGADLLLSQAELNRIFSDSLTLGKAGGGSIFIDDAGIVSNATLNLITGGTVTQTGPLSVGGGTGTLNITAGSTVNLLNAANAFGTLSGGTTNGDFSVNSTTSLTVTGISNTGGDVLVQTNGSLAVNGAINSNGQDVALSVGSALNVNASITATGATVVLQSATALTQTAGVITSANLLAQSAGALVNLPGANVISGNVTINAPAGNITFTNTSGYVVGGISAVAISPVGVFGPLVGAGIRGAIPGTIALNSGGNVTQATGNDIISGQFLVLTSINGGSYTLTNPNNDVASLGANLDGALNYVDIDTLGIGGTGGVLGITTTNDDVTITTGNGNIIVFNANGTPAPDINAGTGIVTLTAGSVGSADSFIDIQVDAGITGTGGVSLTGDNVFIAAPINAGTATATVRPFQDGTLINLGGADGVNTLGLTNGELNFITAGNIVVGRSTAGNLTITAPIAPAGTSQLELVTGASIVSTSGGVDVTVPRLGLTAVTGIGPIVTDVANLEAVTATGGIFITESNDLSIGGVTAALDGVQATTSGDIQLIVGTSLTLDGTSAEDIRTASGNVLVVAGVNVEVRNDSADAIDSNAGNVTIIAGQDILLGSAADDDFGDVEANGNIVFTAGRDLIIDENTDVEASGSGTITATVGRNISVLASDGTTGSSITTRGGAITLTTGLDGTLTIDSDDAAGAIRTTVGGGNGDITISADRLIIAANNSVRAGTGTVTIQPASSGRLIDLGSTTDVAANTLEISAAELASVFAGLIRIGNPNFSSGNITVTAPVAATNSPILSLFSGGSITSPPPGSITATNLALHAGNGIGTATQPLTTIVENVAFLNFGGLVNISNTGLLTVTAVDDLATSDNFSGTTTLTASAGAGPSPGGIVFEVDTFSQGTLTANALESPQPEDDIRVKFLIEVVSQDGDVIFNAGDGIIAEENSFIGADGDVRLAFGVNDVDGISFIDLRGFITARTLTLVGSSVHETITLANLDKIDVRLVSIFTGVGQPDTVALLDNALSNEINASLRLGVYVEVLGFSSEVRVYETNTADTLILAGREGNDRIVAQPGVESLVGIVLDGGTGDDSLLGIGTLVGGEGNDVLNGGTGNDTLLGDGGVEFLYGITTGNQLVRFSPEAPDSIVATVAVTGLLGSGGETLVGIDVRPATGALYVLSNDAGVGRLYTIDPLTGAATFVATLAADVADTTSPYTTLAGTEFGVDFNPVPDRLRVVSSSGQNLRINVDTGAVTTDGNINGATTTVVSAAYANNFVGTTTTTLYTIDATSDSLFIQNPPNNGTEVLVGALGVDASDVLGFDIVPGTGTAYAALTVGGLSGLYFIDLFNGRATLVGNFGGGATLRGLAVGATQGNDTINAGFGNDTLVGGFGNDVLVGGSGNDRIEAGDGDDSLDGGDGNDTLNGFTGNDVLSGGTGFDTLVGGTGTDVLRETRDANFTLTNAALTIGSDGAEALSGIEGVELTGGPGANVFNVGAYTGALKVTGGDGSDTLDYSAATLGVSLDLDLVGSRQFLNAGGASLVLGDVVENFTGTDFNDVIFVDAQSFTRLIDGNAPTVLPGTANAPIPPGDQLSIDGRGQFVKVTKIDANTGTVETPGFATIAYDDIEILDKVNSSSSGGFNSTGSGSGSAFTALVSYEVGKSPAGVVTGDINGDGFDDLVTVNTVDNTVSVLLAVGDGTFAPAVNYSTGGLRPVSIVLANVDDDADIAGGDSDLDIVVTNTTSRSVAVLLNDGAGGFGAASTFLTAGSPSLLRVGDFNNDGLVDLAALSKKAGAVSILLNSGGGVAGTASFAPFTRIALPGKPVSDFAVGDFDGDVNGNLDLAVLLPTIGRLAVLTGDGTGAFTAQPTRYNVGVNPTVMAIADYNNDGFLDVAVIHKFTQAASVLLGTGSTGGDLFLPQLRTFFNAVIRSSTTLVSGDFDGDGNADLAFGSDNGTTLRVALGTGTGLFEPVVRFNFAATDPGVTAALSGIAVGDFNGDGAPDIVVANRTTSKVNVAIRTPIVS